MDGKQIGGQNVSYGLADGAVGIPAEHPNYSDEIYNQATEIGKQISAGAIVPPSTEDEYNTYIAGLN